MDIRSAIFRLDTKFINKYIGKQPQWGPLGYITFKRSYARPLDSIYEHHQQLAKDNGLTTTEEFWLTLIRVIEGTYRIQEAHCKELKLPWNNRKAQNSAQEMFKLMWDFKFSPPGRGLWMMGTPSITEKGATPLNSCAFISTSDLTISFSEPFCFSMDMSMLGIGMGCDTLGAGTITIRKPRPSNDIHTVEDSREGWVDIVRRYLDAYVNRDTIPSKVDFSQVRAAGSPIKGFGGVSAGPVPLAELLVDIQNILNPLIGETITSTAIVDLIDVIARCVVSGNTRRSAAALLGDPLDEDFLSLKNPVLYPEECKHHRWCSNNSVFALKGMDYSQVAKLSQNNGEPGYFWLENARDYSRMIDLPDFKDKSAAGCNVCFEQTLWSKEICNLADVFPAHHNAYREFERTLKFAYLYAKTVTLLPTHNPRTNAVVLQNRRIGTSMSGVIQAFNKHGRATMRDWSDKGYKYLRRLDGIYSSWLCIPQSIKITSIKPSGTTSLLCGATPGIHYPHSEYYYRVIRFATNSTLLPKLKDAGYHCVELDQDNEPNTVAVYFAVKEDLFKFGKKDITLWEQMENAALMQAYWADNQVSATISFKPEEANQLTAALELFETRLKAISFMPLQDHKYKHAPYQEITKEVYEDYIKQLKPLDLSDQQNEVIERGCENDTCQI